MKMNHSARTTVQLTNNQLWQMLSDDESQAIKAGATCHGMTVLAWARVDGVSPSPVLSLAT
jgi:hypothetical protein